MLYIVRRIDFNSQESAENTYQNPSNVWETSVCMTKQGEILLTEYNHIKNYSSWCNSYSTVVRDNLIFKNYDSHIGAYNPENNFILSKDNFQKTNK